MSLNCPPQPPSTPLNSPQPTLALFEEQGTNVMSVCLSSKIITFCVALRGVTEYEDGHAAARYLSKKVLMFLGGQKIQRNAERDNIFIDPN